MIKFSPSKQEIEVLQVFEDKSRGNFVAVCKMTLEVTIEGSLYKMRSNSLQYITLDKSKADPFLPGPSDPAVGGTKPPAEPTI